MQAAHFHAYQWRYPAGLFPSRTKPHLILNFADCDAHKMDDVTDNVSGILGSVLSSTWRFSLLGLTAWTFHSYSVQYGTPERGSEGEACRLRGTKEGSP